MNRRQTRVIVARDADDLPTTLEALIGARRSVLERRQSIHTVITDDAFCDADSVLKQGEN